MGFSVLIVYSVMFYTFWVNFLFLLCILLFFWQQSLTAFYITPVFCMTEWNSKWLLQTKFSQQLNSRVFRLILLYINLAGFFASSYYGAIKLKIECFTFLFSISFLCFRHKIYFMTKVKSSHVLFKTFSIYSIYIYINIYWIY
jgi:hypothetical protein